MISNQLAQKVKELELHTRRILATSSVGTMCSRQKGFGFEFDQLRGYQYGDDVRLIDWKSSARTGLQSLLVRQYFEERNRSFMICLDVSASTLFGSSDLSKQEVMQQIAGVLALAACWSKDKFGLILFSEQIECVMPPGSGRAHANAIVEKIFSHTPQFKTTNFNVLCDYVAQKVAAKTTMLVVSDFIAPDFTSSLKKILNKKNFIAITCLDSQETELKDVGLVWMQDPETEQLILVNTKNSGNNTIARGLHHRLHEQRSAFFSSKIDTLVLKNHQTFMHDLITFFQKRMVY